jgi:hypothetical protein
MPSGEGKFFSRFWSRSSAGGLICGKGLDQRKELSFEERNEEFNERHKHFKDEPELTAFVSVSDKLSRTISGALQRAEKERAEDVWIALIYVPHSEGPVPYHTAADLVSLQKSLFKSEYIFDWEISEEYDHVVSLRTLLDRDIERYIDLENKNTFSLQQDMKRRTKLLEEFDIGLYFAAIARCFGARAPVQYIASQLCIEAGRNCSELIRDSIEKSIIDWWLADLEFVTNLDIHNEEAEYMRYEIHEQMEVLEDKVFWLAVEAFERRELVSEGVLKRIASKRHSLTEKLKSANEAIEREVIKIGLR